MGRAGAAVGSAVFFALAPGVVAGLVPWWLTGWEASDLPVDPPAFEAVHEFVVATRLT